MHSSMILFCNLDLKYNLFIMVCHILLSTHQKLTLLNIPHVSSINFEAQKKIKFGQIYMVKYNKI